MKLTRTQANAYTTALSYLTDETVYYSSARIASRRAREASYFLNALAFPNTRIALVVFRNERGKRNYYIILEKGK